MENEEYQNLFLPLYQKWSFVVPKEVFMTLAKDVILAHETSPAYVLLKELERSIRSYIVVKMDHYDTALAIIMNEMPVSFQAPKTYEDAFPLFQKMVFTFHKLKYRPVLDMCIYFLKTNSQIDTIVKYLVEKNLPLIQKKGELYKNVVANTFIEAYCTIHNINILGEDICESLDPSSMTCLTQYFKDIRYVEPILNDETKIILEIKKGNEQAKELLIYRYLRYVVHIAKKYVNKGLDLEDLIQEGNLGLLKAVAKFELTKGASFITYATYWIKQSISRALNEKRRNIRIPVYVEENIAKYLKAARKLEEQWNRPPTLLELAKTLKWSVSKVEETRFWTQDTLSLEYDLTDDFQLQDSIVLNERLEDTIVQEDMVASVKKLIEESGISDRNYEILKYRFGFQEEEPYTRTKIAAMFDVSRESIRQSEERILKKIRCSKNITSYAVYTNNPTQSLENLKHYQDEYHFFQTYKLNSHCQKNDGADILRSEVKKICNLIQKTELHELLDEFSYKETVILCLKFGINGRTCSDDELQHFFGVEEQDLKMIYMNGLLHSRHLLLQCKENNLELKRS